MCINQHRPSATLNLNKSCCCRRFANKVTKTQIRRDHNYGKMVMPNMSSYQNKDFIIILLLLLFDAQTALHVKKLNVKVC